MAFLCSTSGAVREPAHTFFNHEAAHEVVLRNLPQRRGYADLEDMREEGCEDDIIDAILTLARTRISGGREG